MRTNLFHQLLLRTNNTRDAFNLLKLDGSNDRVAIVEFLEFIVWLTKGADFQAKPTSNSATVEIRDIVGGTSHIAALETLRVGFELVDLHDLGIRLCTHDASLADKWGETVTVSTVHTLDAIFYLARHSDVIGFMNADERNERIREIAKRFGISERTVVNISSSLPVYSLRNS
ncbi:hypothetical protein [Rhizobium sp. OAE497]|uniref:hypothetical protein n=1 Tax=Rhizobium sp. OAE497 TaxID=2663796 RepID=UPI0018F4F7BF